MDFLNILQTILIAVGGDGNPQTEYVRHFLPMVIWATVFFMVWTLHYGSSKRDLWFLIAISSAFLYETSQLITKFMEVANAGLESEPSAITFFEGFSGPIDMLWIALTYWLLAFVTCRFINLRDHIGERICPLNIVGILVAVTAMAVVAHWMYETRGGVIHSFENSVNHSILFCLPISILAFATIVFWRSRRTSYASRIAWVPFALFLLCEVLKVTDIFTGREFTLWLLPIAKNMKIWATPWFGFLFWRYAIGEQRQLAQRLEQAERLDGVGRLAAGVAHDFNNHLQAILGYATAGAVDEQNNRQHQNHFAHIKKSVDRASVLVKLLTNANRQPAEDKIDVVKLSQVLTELKPLLRSLLGTTVKLDFYLDPEADLVCAGRSLLEQVILNAVLNARDAMPNGGSLTVSSEFLVTNPIRALGGTIRITIADSGSGLSAAERSKVFEPFYTTKGEGGSGLGLTSSLNAILRMGGQMELVSKLGKGTKLIIDLPAAQQSVLPVFDQEPQVFSAGTLTGSGRILIADDEPAVRHVVASFLQRAGYDVLSAADGEEALKLLSMNFASIDLMILDVLMPKKCGYETYLAARERQIDIPVIFITGQFDRSNCRVPSEPHLIKPFKQEALLQLVRTRLNVSETEMTPA